MLEYDFQLKLVQETEILGNYTARSEHEFLQQYSYQQEGGRWKNLRHCQNLRNWDIIELCLKFSLWHLKLNRSTSLAQKTYLTIWSQLISWIVVLKIMMKMLLWKVFWDNARDFWVGIATYSLAYFGIASFPWGHHHTITNQWKSATIILICWRISLDDHLELPSSKFL